MNDESVLLYRPPLQSVTTDRGEGGMKYYVGEDVGYQEIRMTACAHINVSIEPGPMGVVPMAVCVLHDGTVKGVNLAAALEWEIADKVPEKSNIILPPTDITKPN